MIIALPLLACTEYTHATEYCAPARLSAREGGCEGEDVAAGPEERRRDLIIFTGVKALNAGLGFTALLLLV